MRSNIEPSLWALPGTLVLVLALASAVPARAASPSVEDSPARPEENAPALDGGHLLRLDEAIARALERNEGIVIESRSLHASRAAESRSRGAYDPVVGLDGGWRRTTVPVNSAFSGAPEGELAPTDEVAEAGAFLRQLLPTGGEVVVRARGSREESDGSFGLLVPAWGSRLGLEVRQPLLRNRAIDPARLSLRVAARDRDRALAALRREVRDTVAEVESAYWRLVAARRDVQVQVDAVDLAEAQLSQTGHRIESGQSPETEIAQPRAELERRRGDLLRAREEAARAESALKLLVLGDGELELWSSTLVPVDDMVIDVVPVDRPAALRSALASRSELDAATALVERRKIEKDFAIDRVRPSLDLVASWDRYGLAGRPNPSAGTVPGLSPDVPAGLEGGFRESWEGIVDDDFDDTRVGLVFEVPIGNRVARADAVIAEDTLAQAEAALARARKVVRAQVLDAAAALETAGGRIEAARAGREAAEVQLAAEQERYAVGLSTNFLVLTRQNDLAEARLDETRALTDYRAARIEMARATGDLLTDRGIEIDGYDADETEDAEDSEDANTEVSSHG